MDRTIVERRDGRQAIIDEQKRAASSVTPPIEKLPQFRVLWVREPVELTCAELQSQGRYSDSSW
ncbi:MAG TPA: hypothetical protein VJQ83_04980 [Tepidiformaceae bacterium]|nr:hypothetical protein [Tepidiformaceae bacterium]